MTLPLSATEQGNQPLDQLTLLYALADHIQRARHVDMVYQEAVDGLRAVAEVDYSVLLVLDNGLMRPKAWSGLSDACRAELEGYAPWPASARDPRPVVVADVASSPETAAVRGALLDDGVRSLTAVPLLHRGRLLGEILLLRRQEGGLAESVVRLTEAIAGHLALAIGRSRSDADQAELLRRFESERSVLESVVKQMPAGVLLADVPSGRIILTNQQITATWGRTLGGATSIADYGAWHGLDASGGHLAAEQWPLARSVLHGETVRGEEIEIVRRDGSRGRVRMSSAPVLDSQGRQLAAVATVYDVTREREQEAQQAFLEEATRTLNRSLEVKDTLEALARVAVGRYADWCVVYTLSEPDRVERAVAVHADPAHAETVEAFAHGSFPLDSDNPVARVIREREPLLAAEVTPTAVDAATVGDDGRSAAAHALRPTSGLILPLMARDQPLGALSVVRSAGRYGQAEMELMEELARRAALALDNAILYEQARAADRAKANFLAVMSHEFRTPLSAILGYADILTAKIHGDLNDKQAGHLQRVKASVRHLSHLVDEILSYASMEAGRERVRPEQLDVVSLAADAAAIMEPIAEAAGLELKVSLPDGPVELRTDGSKVRQILINLLSNAVKYTPSGQIDFAMEVRPERVEVRVVDTGPGIPREHLEDVFEPFWQVDRSDGRRINGTGLGLAVARRLGRLLGGDVRLESEVGVGSTFTLDLPTQPVEEVATGPVVQ